MRKALATLAFIAILAPGIARADVGLISGSVSASATGATTYLQLAGQANCNIVTSGNAAGLSATVQIAADNYQTWSTSTGVGASGVITANGTVGGSITTTTVPVPTAIRLNVTALTSGTATFQIFCAGSTSSGGGGGGTTTLLASTAQIGYLQSWTQTQFTATSATVIKASAGVVSGLAYLSNTAMANTQQITCYDNASALSGTVVLGPWTLPSGFMPSFPAGGIAFANGLTCAVTAGAALTSPVAVYTH